MQNLKGIPIQHSFPVIPTSPNKKHVREDWCILFFMGPYTCQPTALEIKVMGMRFMINWVANDQLFHGYNHSFDSIGQDHGGS